MTPNETYKRLLNQNKKKLDPAVKKKPDPVRVFSTEERIKSALKSMGHYFELDEKEVKFYIRQLELNGKL